MKNRKPVTLSAHLREVLADGRLKPLARIAAGFGALSPLMALANPTGGQVVGGAATIAVTNPNTTQITQTSQNAVINWQSFSVGANQYVQFLQPDSSATVLNRVIGSSPSNIFGNITANGQVFLVNSNGILFGKGAVLDVGSLVASTQDISDSDFMSGKYNFIKGSGAPDASVINQGAITASNGGYVVLAGDYVENDGTIQAQTGQVLLTAGGGTTLTLSHNQLIGYAINGATLANLAGVSNTGDITAEGGVVVMNADVANALTATAVNNSGFIAARSIQGHGGLIVLSATGGDTENSGTLDASASQVGVTGGTIVVRSNENSELKPTSVIDTQGSGANGGFVDLSGHEIGIHGQMNIGQGGKLLFDPLTMTIESGGTLSSICGGCEGGVIHAGFITRELNAGVGVAIIASNSIGHSAGVTNITATGTGNLELKIGNVGPSGGSLGHFTGGGYQLGGGTGLFSPLTGGTIELKGLTINIAGAFGASAQAGTVELGKVTAAVIAVNAGTIKLNGDLTTTAATPTSHRGIELQASGSIVPGTGSPVSNLIANAGNVLVSVGGGVHITGGISAHSGSVDVVANSHSINIGGSISAKTVILERTGYGIGGSISAHNITATGTLGASGSIGGVNIANTGILILNQFDGIKAGASTAVWKATAGGIKVVGGGNTGITLGGVSAAGSLVVTAEHGSPSKITVLGSTDALKAKSVVLTASGSYGGVIKTNAITATGSNGSISIQARNISTFAGAASVTAGNLTGPVVFVSVDGRGSKIAVGNVSAGISAQLRASNFGSGDLPVSIQAGKITSPVINISAEGPQGAITSLGTLSAVNPSGAANVTVRNYAGSHAGSLTIKGPITVSGKTPAAPHSSSNGQPNAANLSLDASGSAAVTQKLTVEGAINVTATKGHFMGTHSNEGGLHGPTRTVFSGSGGLAHAAISAAGTASVQGAIKVSGADAELSFSAKKLTVGNVTVAASGHTFTQTAAPKSSPTAVFASSTSDEGTAKLVLGNSGSGQALTAGNISVTGVGVAKATLAAQNITVGGVTVTAAPATGSFQGTHATGASHSKVVHASQTFTHGGSADLLVLAHGSARAGSSLASFTSDIKVKGPTATVSIQAGAIHAKNVTVTGSGSTIVRHVTGSNSAGAVSYSATIKSGVAALAMQASFGASGNSKASITAGNITAQGVAGGLVSLRAATINTGNISVKATKGSLAVTGTAPGSASSLFGPPRFYASGATTQTLAAFPIAGVNISQAQSATPVLSVSVGNIAASDTAGVALVRVDNTSAAVAKFTTGSISVTGKGPTDVNPQTGQFQAVGAQLTIQAGTGSQNTVTINGNVKLTGKGAHYSLNVPTGTQAGLTSASGTDGWVRASIEAGKSVTLNGAFTETAVGLASGHVNAGTIKITGPVSVSATPALNVHSASGSTAAKTTFTMANTGRAFFGLSGNSLPSDSVSVGGAITMSGTENVSLHIQGANITTKAITVTANPTGKFKFTTPHPSGDSGSLHSSGSKVGWASVDLHALGSASAAKVTVGGAINVAGVGLARVTIAGSHVTAQGITVTAAAESATEVYSKPLVSGHPLFSNNSLLAAIDNGHESGAYAAIQINGAQNGYGSGHFFALPALSVDITGNLTVKAAGLAQIQVQGHSVDVTGNVTASASKAVVSGKDSDSSHDTRTLSGSVGLAEVSLSAGTSAGAVSVGGAVKVQGPDATLQVNASTITLGNVTVTGSGHTVTTTETPHSGSTVVYSSHNDGGFATVSLSNVAVGGITKPAPTVKTGNITVSGKGLAEVEMLGSHVSAGSINVTATTATVTRSGSFVRPPSFAAVVCTSVCDSGSVFFDNFNGARISTGTKVGGDALLVIGANLNSGSGGQLARAKTISVGPIAVSGVGSANVVLLGSSVQAKGITVTATKGSLTGKGSSTGLGSGSIFGTFKNSISSNGGNAGIEIRGGSNGIVTVTGNLSATGPVAGVKIKSKEITVTGGITVKGTGGSVTTDTVFTSSGNATTYHLHYVGSGGNHLNGVDLEASDALSVGGTIKLTAPGLAGILAVGKTVALGGISASVTGPVHYSVLNTHKSATAVSFSASDLALVTGGRTSGGVFVPAVVSGNVTLTAKGNIYMADDLSVAGAVTVKAGGNITGSAGGVIIQINNVTSARSHHPGNSSGGSVNSGQLPLLSLSAQSIDLSAGKNLFLDSDTLTATKALDLHAGGSIFIGSAALSGSAVNMTAVTVTNSGSGSAFKISAGAGGLTLKATSNISLAGETLNVGTGPTLISAGGSLALGKVTLIAGGGVTLKATTGDIDLTSATLAAGGDTTLTGAKIENKSATLNITGNLTETGSSIDLTSATATVTKSTTLSAGKNIILTGVDITTAALTATAATGSIEDGGPVGTITAGAVAMVAGTGINLSSTQLNIGNGTLSAYKGDGNLLAGLATKGVNTVSANPNAVFIANGGPLLLGGLTLTGSYLLLEAPSVSLLGTVSVPTGTLVQVAPINATQATDVEDTASGLTTGLNFAVVNQGFINLFPGDTLAIGVDSGTGQSTTPGYSGDVGLGSNGAFSIGNTNLVVQTGGNVTGLANVTSSGFVTLLSTLLAGQQTLPTPGTVGATTGGSDTQSGTGDQTDKKKLSSGGAGTANGQQGGTTTQDSGTGSVCH